MGEKIGNLVQINHCTNIFSMPETLTEKWGFWGLCKTLCAFLFQYVEGLKKTESHIIILTSLEYSARAVICQAYKAVSIYRHSPSNKVCLFQTLDNPFTEIILVLRVHILLIYQSFQPYHMVFFNKLTLPSFWCCSVADPGFLKRGGVAMVKWLWVF